jgi:membrane protein YdbS with pleckstrin-like domain
VYWSLSFDKTPTDNLLNCGNLLVTLIMSVWYLYTFHNRQIYLYKLHRIHELEEELNMRQHLRFINWKNEDKKYKTSPPSGHHLNFIIYLITTLGSLILGYVGRKKIDMSWLNIIIIIVIILVSVYAIKVERDTKKVIKKLS